MVACLKIGSKVVQSLRNRIRRRDVDGGKPLRLSRGDQRLFERLGGQKSRSE